MKKYVMFVLSLSLVVSLCSCGLLYKETIITDIKQYDDIWSFPENRHDRTPRLFPRSINEENVVEFIFKYTDVPLTNDWQVLLKMKYDDVMFLSEKERLEYLCAHSTVCGDTPYFDNPAYATIWNCYNCFQYAIFNEEEKTVSYVYLQLISEYNLFIDKSYFPKGYTSELLYSKEFYCRYHNE